jgi:uncharacterized protein YbbC (DUF1343 family)
MEYVQAVLLLSLLITFIYYIQKDSTNHRTFMAGINKLKVDYLEVMKKQRLLEISHQASLESNKKLSADVDAYQEHMAKMRDTQRIILKQNRILRENMVKRLEVTLPVGFTTLAKKINKQMDGLSQ